MMPMSMSAAPSRTEPKPPVARLVILPLLLATQMVWDLSHGDTTRAWMTYFAGWVVGPGWTFAENALRRTVPWKAAAWTIPAYAVFGAASWLVSR
ncbi:hypothetical protein ACFC4C_06965 [Streptomyces sp. NPDC056039]|uniref:hypothetical protein n=1 Tax=Streptomyces sp. NPDC056039 TaxID=3345687 RepID=UPI0035D827FD